VRDVRLALGLMTPPGPLERYYDASLEEEARR
jgi:hypothetical protein